VEAVAFPLCFETAWSVPTILQAHWHFPRLRSHIKECTYITHQKWCARLVPDVPVVPHPQTSRCTQQRAPSAGCRVTS
jgi:hypothetical protein